MTGAAGTTMVQLSRGAESFGVLHWVAVLLAATTGVIHLLLGLLSIPEPLGVAALLAAGGFAGGIVLFTIGFHRRLVLVAAVPYTASQILLWYALNEPTGIGDVSPLAAFDKVVQLLLIACVILLYTRE